MNLAFVLILGGAVIIAWIYFWARQNAGQADTRIDLQAMIQDVPAAGNDDAVLVAHEHGKLLYINTAARSLLNLNGGQPNLEQVARTAEPTDNFLQLFATEGQTSFQLNDRWVEASSHRIATDADRRMVVVMRELAASASNPDLLNMADAMAVINEIGDNINVTLGMAEALQAILTIVGKHIRYDAAEITLWEEKDQASYQRGWAGDTTYLIALSEIGGKYELGDGITGWIAKHRRPVLLNGRDDTTAIQPKLTENNMYESFVGAPIMLGDRFIGTIEMASKSAGAFTQGDMALLQAVSKQVAVTIYNTEVYGQQVKRINDIASLQEVVNVGGVQEQGVERVYAALNQRIAELLDADMCGILLYDPDREGLSIQLPVHGLPEALVRSIFVSLESGTTQYNIWRNQQSWVSNDLQDEPLVEELDLQPVVSLAGINNTAWLPLEIGGERFGVLAVSNKQNASGFNARDLQNLTILASQAAIVVEKIRLYAREQRMDTELVGLQEITNAIGALSHETEFYGEITERIANLMQIEMVGILLYDDANSQLVSQLPFHGVDDDAVRDYTIPLPTGSVMRELWEDDRYWYSNRVQADTLVFETGLDQLATQLKIEKTLIAVMQASGRRLGVVQVSNKRNEEDFTDSDARLLMIFATQAGAIIENARLFREAQRSAEQAQGLRRVAELAGNVLTTQESVAPVLSQIADLLQTEIVFVNVLDQQRGSLITYPRWIYGIELADPIFQDIYSPGFEHSVAVSQKPYVANNIEGDEQILSSYKQLAGQMDLRDGILVPLLYGDRVLGELGVANRVIRRPFLAEDMEVMQVVASQIASALDRLLLYEATGENLNRRNDELEAISRVSNELASTLDLDQVLSVIRAETIRASGASECSVVLLEDAALWPSPDRPLVQRRVGMAEALPELTDIEREAVQRTSEPVLITDFEFTTMEPMPPQARSGLAVPILFTDDVVGLIYLYHEEPNRFDDRAGSFVMQMAVKASLGYGNALRFEEQVRRSNNLRRRVDQLNRIFELGHMFQTNADPVSILEAIAYSVQQSVGYDTIVMMLLDEETETLVRVAHAGLPVDVFQASKQYTISLDTINKLFDPDYRVSESYFFPIESFEDWYVEGLEALNTDFEGKRTIPPVGRRGWRDGDRLIVRLMGPSGVLVGLMILDRPYDNLRPERGTIEVLEIFANQAASTIENTRLYLSSVASAEQEAQLNDIMEAVSSTLEIEEIVRAVARGIVRMLPFTRMTFALVDSEGNGFDLLRVVVQPNNEFEILRENRVSLGATAMNRTYNDARDYLYTSAESAQSDYEDLIEWHESGEKTTLILPMLTGGETLGVIHIGSDLDQAYGFREFRVLLRRMAQLVASSVQNARLFDQAVNLQILNESVVESIQQGIIVLDNSGHVISINSFLTDRYGWKRNIVGADLFEYAPEVAEPIKEPLMAVLNQGNPQERLNQTITREDGEAIISNFYMYPLRFGLSVRGAVILVEDVTDRSRLEQAMESRANQLAALTDVSTRITSSLERDEVVQVALQEMGWLVPHAAMSLWRRNGSYMVLEGATGFAIDETRALNERFLFSDFDLIRHVVETQRVVVAATDEIDIPDALDVHTAAESWMGVPLVNQGHVVGMVMVTERTPNAYQSSSDQNIAFAFASQVAIALANADLFEQTFDRTNELGTLLEAAQATSLTTDLDSVFQTVVELMFSALEMDDCSIMTWDEVDNQLEVQLDMNREGDEDVVVPAGTIYDLSEYPARLRALRDREVVVIVAEDGDSPYPKEIEELTAAGDAARMLVPLIVRESARGLIQLGSRSTEAITQQKVRLARALGSQVAVAIENARLSAETTAHFEESLIINDLSRAISSTLNLDDMFNVVRDQMPGVTGANELYLAIYDESKDEINFPLAVRKGEAYEIPPRRLGKDEVSFIIKHRRPLNLGADYYSPDELRKSLGIEGGETDARSYLGVPLIAGDEVYGVLAVRDTERTRAFSINEQRILTTVGSQLGAAIQNARLFRQVTSFADDLEREVAERTRELEDERDRIDTLYQITSELARTLDMERLMPRALGMVAKAVGAQDGVIMQLDPITDQLYSRAVLNPNSLQENPTGDRPIHPAERIARWIIMEDEHVRMVNDLLEEDYWDADASGAVGWRSAIAVLLETNEELLGVMVFLSQDIEAFNEAHVRLMVAAANQVASSINNAELYKMIREQAERLAELFRAEQEEADKNKAILEGIADGVVLADNEGNIMLFNNAAERILRVSRQEAIGKSLTRVAGVHGASASTWADALERRLINPDDPDARDFLDERLELGDRTVSVHLSPVYTGERFLGTVSVFRDVTREVEAERSKSEFVANVSHEFRTPLTSIKGYNDLLLMGAFGQFDDQQKKMLDTIKDNVTRLAALVEDVLNISKIDSGREQLSIEQVDMNRVIDQVLENLLSRPNHQGKDITVEFEPLDDLPLIQADPEKVTRIISNIIDNAFNYTLAGGSIDIHVEPDDQNNRLQIVVKDTGVGVPEEFRDSIWERFKRHDETAVTLDVAGTGLGLPIVKELVEMHHGDIWFESEVGTGTTFFIRLPYNQPEYLINTMAEAGSD